MAILKPPSRQRKLVRYYENQIYKNIMAFFKSAKKTIVAKIIQRYENEIKSNEDLISRILMAITIDDFKALPASVQELYRKLASSGIMATLKGVKGKVDDETFQRVFKMTDDLAIKIASEQSANLIGMRVLADGSIVPNPNAKWRIDEATRIMLRDTITEAVENGISSKELAKLIADDFAFSMTRAKTIARTEVASVDVKSTLQTWIEAGLNHRNKIWLISEDPCPLCQENANQGVIPFSEEFINGDPPVHPNCTCDIALVVED